LVDSTMGITLTDCLHGVIFGIIIVCLKMEVKK
jgi:hypothetical protein